MNKQRAVIYENRNFVLEAVYVKEFLDAAGKEEFKNVNDLKNHILEKGFERLVYHMLEKYEIIERVGDIIRITDTDLLEGEIST